MFKRKRGQSEPMTTLHFFCVFLPKFLLFVSIAAYLIGGTILFVADENAWSEGIKPWGITEIGFCLVIAIWLGIGKALYKRAQENDVQSSMRTSDVDWQGKTRENKENLVPTRESKEKQGKTRGGDNNDAEHKDGGR